MFKNTLDTIRKTFSGQAALGYVADITRYHRIQASPGLRQAAHYCRDLLTGWGIEAEVLSFPADERTYFWSAQMFQEWEATKGALHLVAPEDQVRKLADYQEVKLSLIPRSAPFEGEAEVVLLEDGEEESEYAGLDLTGKVVMTKGDLERVRILAVEKRGAVGIIHDGMREVKPVRETWDLPDALQYNSFWWAGNEVRCFGFTLPPREGDRLRRLIKKHQEEGKGPVRVRAKVEARLYDGQIECVSALIPGQTDEEVLVVSHICHPQPSANDNASGAAAALEMARALHGLIASGELAQPRRGIRFLWVPEMTGTYAYLAANEGRIPKTVAGINLDMVGEDQAQCGSVLLLIGAPAAAPGFTDDLLAGIADALSDEASGFAGAGGYPLFRWAATPYSGGSDHYILGDPTVGIPCPMLNQWPDKFYHTSADSLDKVDPQMLTRAGVLAATYAYFLAVAARRETTWLGEEMVSRFKGRAAREVQGMVTAVMAEGAQSEATLAQTLSKARRRIAFLADRQQAALTTLERLSPGIEVHRWRTEVALFAQAETMRAQDALAEYLSEDGFVGLPQTPRRELDEDEQRAAKVVPQRLYRGPVSTRPYLRRLSTEEREAWYRLHKEHREFIWSLPVLALYWADGRRTLLEIADLVELETGKQDVAFLTKYFELLAKMGLVEPGQG